MPRAGSGGNVDEFAKQENGRARPRPGRSYPERWNLRASLLALLVGLLPATSGAEPSAPPALPPRALKAKDVFDLSRPVIFSDDFATGSLDRWNFSEDDRYRLPAPDPKRIVVVDAPGMPGRKAVRMTVRRAPNSFRAEMSLPHEPGFNERWYGARFFIPENLGFRPEPRQRHRDPMARHPRQLPRDLSEP